MPHVPHQMRVLITGHHGYAGSVMAGWLASQGFDIVGLDIDYFRDCTIAGGGDGLPSIVKDVRDVTADDLRGFAAVVHLAALTDCSDGQDPGWTYETNVSGAVWLAEQARAAGVRRFVFFSSIMPAPSATQISDETMSIDAHTAGTRFKALAERGIVAVASGEFSPVILRAPTLYGLSPRMRFDTLVNQLMGSAVTEGSVHVESDGTQWRPVVHVGDIAPALAAVLAAPDALVHNQVFNTGADGVNIQEGELARTIADLVPGCRVILTGAPRGDQGSSRASFAKFSRAFPRVRFRTPAQGARDLFAALDALPLTRSLFHDVRFGRGQSLSVLVATGKVPTSTRRRAQFRSPHHTEPKT